MIAILIKRISTHYKINYLKPFGLSITAMESGDFNSVVSGDELKALARTYRFVIFRGFNELETASLVAYTKTMGPLLEWEFGNVMEMKVQESAKNYLFTPSHAPFHWDGAFHTEPRFLVFHCIEAPDKNAGGETLFTDTHQIWVDSSEAEKAAWAHYQLTYKTEKLAHYGGQITVSLVKNHPDTNEKILRFAEPVPNTMQNPVEVDMPGIDPITANEFMQDMAARCYDKKYCYTHTWNKHDFLIADNHATLHARHAFKHFTPRHLRRIQVL